MKYNNGHSVRMVQRIEFPGTYFDRKTSDTATPVTHLTSVTLLNLFSTSSSSLSSKSADSAPNTLTVYSLKHPPSGYFQYSSDTAKE